MKSCVGQCNGRSYPARAKCVTVDLMIENDREVENYIDIFVISNIICSIGKGSGNSLRDIDGSCAKLGDRVDGEIDLVRRREVLENEF